MTLQQRVIATSILICVHLHFQDKSGNSRRNTKSQTQNIKYVSSKDSVPAETTHYSGWRGMSTACK
jgi:hypothetical protein